MDATDDMILRAAWALIALLRAEGSNDYAMQLRFAGAALYAGDDEAYFGLRCFAHAAFRFANEHRGADARYGALAMALAHVAGTRLPPESLAFAPPPDAVLQLELALAEVSAVKGRR